MTRETKLGMVVAGSFMTLVMGVMGVKYVFKPSTPVAETHSVAQAPSHAPTVPPEPLPVSVSPQQPMTVVQVELPPSVILPVRNDFAIPPDNDPPLKEPAKQDVAFAPPPDFDVPAVPPRRDDFSSIPKKNPVLRIQVPAPIAVEPVVRVDNREPKKEGPPTVVQPLDATPAIQPPDAPPALEFPEPMKEIPVKKEPLKKIVVPAPPTIDLLSPDILEKKDVLPGIDQPLAPPKLEVAPPKIEIAPPKLEAAPLRFEAPAPKIEVASPKTELVAPAEISLGATKVDAAKQDANFDEDFHSPKPNETYRSLSKQYYNSEAYSVALQRYNKDHPGQADNIRLPPIWVLEKKYAADVTGGNGSARSVNYTAAPAAVEAAPSNSPVYTVHDNGEMLAEVAKRALGTEDAWKRIWDLNPQINPAKTIPGGTRLRLPEGARTP